MLPILPSMPRPAFCFWFYLKKWIFDASRVEIATTVVAIFVIKEGQKMENTNTNTSANSSTATQGGTNTKTSSWTETCGLGGILLIAAGAVAAGVAFAAEVGSELFRSLFGDD